MTIVHANGAATAGGIDAPAVVSLDGVAKAFHSVVALDGVDLRVGRGELVCVVGASGCGKSTLLNLVAGLDPPSRGTVRVDGRCASRTTLTRACQGW